MNLKPYLIGIAGPSGAGKSHLARHLLAALGHAVVLPMDSYYPDLGGLPSEERALRNFDDPRTLDSQLLIAHVQELAAGNEICKPVYDFSTHTRSEECEVIQPAEYVLVEGLYALYWPALRDLMGTKIYVDAGDDICLARRIERDVRERGRSRESVIAQYYATVFPMAETCVRPTAQFADIVLSGADPVAGGVQAVLRHIRLVTKVHIPASGGHDR